MAKFIEDSSRKSVTNKKKRKKYEGTGKPAQKPQASPTSSAKEIEERFQQKYGGGSSYRPYSEIRESQTETRSNNQSRTSTSNQTTSVSRNPRMQDTAFSTDRTTPATAREMRQQRQTPSSSSQTSQDRPRYSTAEEMRRARQAQKMGLNSQLTAEDKAAARRAVKNTPTVAVEAGKQALIGHGKTASDITAWNKSAAIGSKIDIKSADFQKDIEKRRLASTAAAEKAYNELSKKQETSEALMRNATKDAKGLEKAYYGALESGVGMATDMAVGAATGTGQFGTLAAMGSRTYGTTRGKAQQEGATESEDRLYSALQAAKEVATERIFVGAGVARKAYGRNARNLGEIAGNVLLRNLKGRPADIASAAFRLGGGVLEENAEEAIAWGLDPLIKEYTYGRNVRRRGAKAEMQARSDALRSNIENEEDARAAAAYLSSDSFIDETVKAYKEAGLSQAEAEETAQSMREYLTASLTGDTDRMAELEDEVSKKIAGTGKLTWDFGELKDTIAATTLLTATTGLPGTVTSSMKGAAIRENLGSDGVSALAKTAIDFEDDNMHRKAKAMNERIESGKELTATQTYDLMVGMQQQVAKDTERETASQSTAQKAINNENLVTPYAVNQRTGEIVRDTVTEQKFQAEKAIATDAINDVLSQRKESLTDTEIDKGSTAIANFQAGTFTVNDANALNWSNTAVRTAFEDATGIDLEKYTVKNKDGSVNIPATNAATKDALFAMAADNLVQSARAETANWMDNAKGEVVTQVTARMGAEGSVAFQKALDGVDERDRSTYMMVANASDMLYQTARNMGTSWENVKGRAKQLFPNISEDRLEMMYDAGLKDRAAANYAAEGMQVQIGKAIEMNDSANKELKGKVFVNTAETPNGSTMKVFSEIASNLGVNIYLVDNLETATGNQANGQYIDGNIYINVNSDFEQNIGYIFMHEVTHHIKLYAPAEYAKLENLVRETWFEANPEMMQSDIANRIALYKRNGQTLTEEQALEEIIADAAHEFLNDSTFAESVAEEDPSLAKVILNSVRDILRKLRNILAQGQITNETHMNSLFSQLNILSEAEDLWLNAYAQAAKNQAAVGMVEWENRAYGDTRNSAGERFYDRGIFGLDGTKLSEEYKQAVQFLENGGEVGENGLNVEWYNSLPEVQKARQRIGNERPTIEDNSPERLAMREGWVQDLLNYGSAVDTVVDGRHRTVYNGEVRQDKRIDLIVGLPSSGKSSALVDPISHKYKSRLLDSDEAKKLIPEFDNGWGAGRVHEESSNVLSKALYLSLKRGDNVVLPIVGSKESSIQKRIDLAKEFGYEVHLRLCSLPANKAAARNMIRFVNDARFVDLAQTSIKYMNGPKESFDKIVAKGEIDGYTEVSNDVERGQNPEFISGEEDISYDWRNRGSRRESVLGRNRGNEEGRSSEADTEVANEIEAADARFSIVEDPELIKQLENDSHRKTYRAMALIDGKLYPPMASKVKDENGKWVLQQGMDLGQWVESDITTDPAMFDNKGRFLLRKDIDGTPVPAAYNPYIHSSDSMLNDQFAIAYRRPNMVVVEGEIPESELTSGYRAEHDLDDGRHVVAKDTTGITDWKAGVVQGQLSGKRTVFLTQHFKPTRIVPDSEVAQHINDKVAGTGVVIPYNVVTPSVRKELQKLGTEMAQSKEEKYFVEGAERYSISDDYTIQDGKARWTDERIDSLIKEYGASNPDYSQAYAVLMSPKEFLDLTLSERMLNRWNEGANDPEHPEVYSLNEEELRSNTQTPFLQIWSNDGNRIQGHEGRHRMRALLEAGVESVPVVIRDSDTKYSKKNESSMFLKAQDFGEGPVNANAHVLAWDLVPIKESNRDELIKKFGGDAQVRFSVSEEQAQEIHEAVSPMIRFSTPTERDVLPKARYTAAMGFSNAAKAMSGRAARINALVKNGFSEEQAKQIGDAVSDVILDTGKWIEDDLQHDFTFIGWDDLINAEVKVRKDWKGKVVGVSVSAMVANGEYPVNFDLTTICNKREGIMQVIQELTRIKTNTGKSVLDSVKLTDEDMWNINKALKAEGIDTACLGCFVEARRYYTNRFIASIDSKWNTAVRETRRELGLPEEEYFDFAHGKKVSGEDYTAISDLWTSYEKSKDSKKSPEQRIRILMNEIIKNNEVDSPYLKLVSASDILTPEGIEGLKQISTGKHDLVKTLKSIYGTSAPKEILAFTPYNSEIALLPARLKGQKADKYLRSIGGIRIQSFSDFKIEHVIDHMQMVADMAARKFTCHAYSKVIAFPRIFGLTGQKINMSVMFDITPAEEWSNILGCSEEKAAEYAYKYAGLRFVKEKPTENPDNRPYIETEIEGVHGYLTYLLGDADYINSVYEAEYQKNIDAGMEENEARRKANEAKPFEQSINYREAVELENQDGYKENVGIIAVAYGDEHLKILLADPNVRYVIPYHKSGLPVFVSQKTSLQYARNYEPVQNTKKADPKEKLAERFEEFKKNSKDEYPAIAFFKDLYDNGGSIATTEATATEAAKLHGTGEFDVYKDLGKAKDIKEVSNAYLEDCIKNNLVPVFSEFAGDPNYYKMLFDFAVTDGNSDHIYPQKTVRNNYPGIDVDAKIAAGEKITDKDYSKLREVIRMGAEEQNTKNERRAKGMDTVLDDILSKDSENSILAGTNVNAIRDSSTDYTNPKGISYSITPEMDEEYMSAVESGNMEEAQRYVNEAAKRAGYTTKAYHGTIYNFTEFDVEKSGKNYHGYSKYGQGLYFSDSEEVAKRWGKSRSTVNAFLNLKNPFDPDVVITEGPLLKEYNKLRRRDKALVKMFKERGKPFDREKEVGIALIQTLNELSKDRGYSTNLLKSLGYDGIKAEHPDAPEGSRTFWSGSTEYVVFDPAQVKSADAVTYAEDGSVVPLSERFNPDNNDIRYSLPTQDSDGNILSDGQMDYFKYSQARDEQGRLTVLYHSSPEVFYEFDSDMRGENTGYDNTAYGFFVTDDPKFSSRFGENQMKLYANINKLMISPFGARMKYSAEECERITREWIELIDPEQLEHYEEARKDDPELSLYEWYNDLWGLGEDPNEYAEDYREWLEDAGYDAIEIFEGTEEDLREDGTGTDRPVTTYAVFNSNQLKDIRNTDPTNVPDIRYSTADDESTMTSEANKAETLDELWIENPVERECAIRKRNGKIDFINSVSSKWNPAWLTEGAVLDTDDPTTVTNVRDVIMGAMRGSDTKARYRSQMVNDTLKECKRAYYAMKKGNHSEAADILYDHAFKMVENLEFFVDDDQVDFERWKSLREYVRTTKFTMPEKNRKDLDPSFRKTNYGRILLGDNGIDPTSAYGQLNEIWPEFFPEDMKQDPAGILVAIESALNACQPMTKAYSSEECVEFAGDIADSLYDIVYEGKAYKSLADRYTDKIKAMKARHAEAMMQMQDNLKDIKAQHRDEIKQLKAKHKQDLKAAKKKSDFEIAELKLNREYNIKRLKAEKARAIREERERSRNKIAEERERKAHAALFKKLNTEYKDLTHRLLNPSKERVKNIPEPLRVPLAKMLMAFDLEKMRSKELEEMYGLPTKAQLNFRELKDSIEKVAKEEGEGSDYDLVYMTYADKMAEIADYVDGLTIDYLTSEDINVIANLVKGIDQAIKNNQKLIMEDERRDAQEVRNLVGEGAEENEALYGRAKKYKGPRKFLDNIVNMGELTPIYFFSHIKGMHDMYKQLRSGFDQYVLNEKMIQDKLTKILSNYYKTNRKGQLIPGSEVEGWRHSESAQTFEISNNQSITLTTAQVMSLYCLSKREQAKGHMMATQGGVVASETEAGTKLAKAQEYIKGVEVEHHAVVLASEDIDKIIQSLTPEQMHVADQLQELMSKDMAALGNKASMALLSVEMYKDEQYFPIKVQQDVLPTNVDKINIREKVRNPGFSKPLVKGANNAIVVDDIFSVVASHCNEMNLYSSYAVPIRNFMQVYNGNVELKDGQLKKTKEVLRQAYGDKAIDYIENFVNDINGNSFKRQGGLDDVLDAALGQAKKAAVFANLRVAIQQPTAIVRAFAVMNAKYFMGVRPSTKATQEMLEHCPIALWKSWGYYDTHFGRDIEDVMMGTNRPTKLSYFMSEIYGSLDNMTWGMIWQAVKKEVKAENPNVEEGSEEFWTLCSERASFVFDRTQVVDSPFHRSNDMRSKNGFVKQLTSFQAEPTLSFNVLRQGIVDAYEASKKGEKSKATKALTRVIAVWIGQAATVAIAQSLVDALRRKGHSDDDDDEDELLAWYEEIMKYFELNIFNNFADDVNPINNIYFIKDVVPPIINALRGEYVFGSQNLALQWVDTLTNGITYCKKKWEKGESYSKSWYDCFTELFGGIGALTGLPIKTTMKGAKNTAHWLNKIFGMDVFADDGSVDTVVDGLIANHRKTDEGDSGSTTEKTSGSTSGSGDSKSTGDATADALKDVRTITTKVGKNAVKKMPKTEDQLLAEIEEKTLGLSGQDKKDKIWDIVGDGYTKYVDAGDYGYINKMRNVIQKAGGDVSAFDKKVYDASIKSYKKTISSNPTQEQLDAQKHIRDYLTEHGMTEEQISSDICYKSYTARDLKAALRMGNEEYILDELRPLIQAGLTREDFKRLYKNRNYGAKTYDGKYSDPKYRQSSGSYNWPINGQITSSFGYRDSPGGIGSTNHMGIDIAGNMGDPIGAADGGTVIYVGWQSGGGNIVQIRHDDGSVTEYKHMSGFNCTQGEQVAQGQCIGFVGSTGNSTGPHLHFGYMDPDGNYHDPLEYLNAS